MVGTSLAERFLEAVVSGSGTDEVRRHAPRLDRSLRLLESERDAIVRALRELPLGTHQPEWVVLDRIRALVRAEHELLFECFWQDEGGEGGA